ncbi:MAG: hypothetical protein Tsb0034_27790 [Ekhidna sp.]
MKSLTLLFIFLAASCGGGAGSEAVESDFEAASMEVTDEASIATSSLRAEKSDTQAPVEFEKKVIKTGSLSYSVEDIRNEYARISKLLEQYEAYIASENESKGYDRINYNISIKVPPQHFDTFIAEISKDRKIENRWVNTDDVTDQYYDLRSRIDNKRKLEERYQEILKKADNVRDILEVERNLNQVRGEIESLQGQFKLLSHKIAYSTLDLSYYELIPYELNNEQRPGFWTRLVNAFSGGWNGFLSFLVVLVRLWPFGIITYLVVLLVKKLRKRQKKGDL